MSFFRCLRLFAKIGILYQVTNFEYFLLHYDLKLFSAFYPKVNFGNMSVHRRNIIRFYEPKPFQIGGVDYLDTIYKLDTAASTAWKLLPQRLKTGRRAHIAVLVPDDFAVCSN